MQDLGSHAGSVASQKTEEIKQRLVEVWQSSNTEFE